MTERLCPQKALATRVASHYRDGDALSRARVHWPMSDGGPGAESTAMMPLNSLNLNFFPRIIVTEDILSLESYQIYVTSSQRAEWAYTAVGGKNAV